jgi:TonB family protein
MKRDNTKIIDQYLSGELSDVEKNEFKEELNVNEDLRKELELQQSINDVASRSNLRDIVQSAGKSYHSFQKAKWFFGGVLVIIIAVLIVYFSMYKNESQEEKLNNQELPELKETEKADETNMEKDGEFDHVKESQSQTDELIKSESNFEEITTDTVVTIESIKAETLKTKKPRIKRLIDGLSCEEFLWKGMDTVYISNKGVLISIPKEAFLLNGQPFTEDAIIQWQEAVDGATIMKSGLSTMADNELLESQGMFTISVKSKLGELLEIDKKNGIYIQVPVDEYKEGMQLYDGVYSEDSIINWVNPVALEKIPVPIKMSDLDFYPAGYEDTLNKLKLSQEKRFRDSMYLACEFIDQENEKVKPKENNFNADEDEPEGFSTTKVSQDEEVGMIPPINNKTTKGAGALKGNVVDKDNKEVISNAKVILFSEEETTERKTDSNGEFEFTSIPSGIYGVEINYSDCKPYLADIEISAEKITFLDDIKLSGCTSDIEEDYIPPSKVLSFWNKKFDNTVLATRDFEKRMLSIHKTCDEGLLDLYINNIDKPLYYSDSLAIEMGYINFESFFAERVGKVELDNAHLQNLKKFYTDGIESLKEELKKQREIYRDKNKEFDQKIAKERVAQAIRTRQMNEETLKKETSFNLKQDPFNNSISRQLTRSIGFRINTNNSIKNVDRKVAEATRSRQNFQGNYGGKKIDVKYNDFTVEVKDHKRFARLFTYLLPDKFNSYQRISDNNGTFSYRLNDDISYNIVILGFNEQGFYYHEKTKINEGDFYDIKLESISEDVFKQRIARLNKSRLDEPSPIYKDLAWLKLEKENYRVQKNRIQKEKLLKRIRKVVFSCTEDCLFGTVVPFPDQEAQFPGGAPSMKRFLAENINYPEKAVNESTQGKVFVGFNIEADGSISNVRVVRGISTEIDDEAVRVVRSMPKWTPAQMNGRNVRSIKRIKVDFILAP